MPLPVKKRKGQHLHPVKQRFPNIMYHALPNGRHKECLQELNQPVTKINPCQQQQYPCHAIPAADGCHSPPRHVRRQDRRTGSKCGQQQYPSQTFPCPFRQLPKPAQRPFHILRLHHHASSSRPGNSV